MSDGLAALGRSLGPDILARCERLFDAEQRLLADHMSPISCDVAYGPDDRHRADVYGPTDARDLPVLVFVHGGGFALGDKGDDGSWKNASVGRVAAQAGMIGVVINYRLAPTHRFPAGSEDVGRLVAWLRTNIARFGGDPDKIVLAGTSAGAAHIAGFLKLRADHVTQIRGAILLSGLYGYTPLDAKDLRYYAEGKYDYDMPRETVVATPLPLFVACAEFDPPRFQQEFVGLLGERLERHGVLPAAHVASGHNHYSIAMHIGTADRRLADEILGFVASCTTGSR